MLRKSRFTKAVLVAVALSACNDCDDPEIVYRAVGRVRVRAVEYLSAGLFPATITNPGTVAVQVVGTGQNPPVSIGSTTTVTGIFNAMTGAFCGSARGVWTVHRAWRG